MADLERSLDIRCPWCGSVHKLGEWNDSTYAMCTSREMRRAFTLLTDRKAFTDKGNAYYMCPGCKKWSKGTTLSIVNTDDAGLLKLGRKPNMYKDKNINPLQQR